MSRDTQQIVRGATTLPKATSSVQSVERAAALLRAVASASGSDATATALAEQVGLNRTTAWRILATLEQERLVSLDRTTGRYVLGFGLVDLAGQAGKGSLASAARTVVKRISREIGETVALAVMRDHELTYVAEAVPGAIVSVTFQGTTVPLHATSTGKAYLAFCDTDEARALLGRGRGNLPRYTSTTITSRTELDTELAETRDRGYSECRGEFEGSAWGVSAPVLDSVGQPVAVLSIWGPPERIPVARFASLGALAMRGADELANR